MSKKEDKYSQFGLNQAIEAISFLEGEAREKLIAKIQKEDPDLAEILKDSQLSFESLANVNPAGMQELIALCSDKTLCLSLRGASKELLEKIFSAMSQRKALQIKEEIMQLGPQPKSSVEEARNQVLEMAKNLISSGKMIIFDSKKDKLV